MRVSIHAVGRLKAGPERELAARYLDRFAKAGGAVGLDFAGVTEIAESRARDGDQRMREEAARLIEKHDAAMLVLLDERGKTMSSQQFAEFLGSAAGAGRRDLVIAIGGADGHHEDLRKRAEKTLAFGAMTWPHQLVRVMLAEQLYRAATILSGHPYHRG